MRKRSIFDETSQESTKLEELGLTKENIETKKSKIKVVSLEEANSLGKELYDMVKRTREDSNILRDKVEKLILAGANLEYKEPNKGRFSLMECCRREKYLLAILLLKYGALVDQDNNYKTSSLMRAARYGHVKLVDLFILMGADVNKKYADGETALFSAKRHARKECFDLLINNGAKLYVVSDEGNSVFDIASENNSYTDPYLPTDASSRINMLIERATAEVNEIRKDIDKTYRK